MRYELFDGKWKFSLVYKYTFSLVNGRGRFRQSDNANQLRHCEICNLKAVNAVSKAANGSMTKGERQREVVTGRSDKKTWRSIEAFGIANHDKKMDRLARGKRGGGHLRERLRNPRNPKLERPRPLIARNAHDPHNRDEFRLDGSQAPRKNTGSTLPSVKSIVQRKSEMRQWIAIGSDHLLLPILDETLPYGVTVQ
jgi:hypothetical protein